FGYEAGFGFEFYLPYFIFSPEIKISNGARNIFIRQPGNIYSDRIGEILSRMIVISIHLEG
ncbi:MAG: PorT family protein, partial [Chitinophagaceae bacterium]